MFAQLARDYRTVYKSYQPADARYLTLQRGHLMFLRPEEERFATAGLICATTMTATACSTTGPACSEQSDIAATARTDSRLHHNPEPGGLRHRPNGRHGVRTTDDDGEKATALPDAIRRMRLMIGIGILPATADQNTDALGRGHARPRKTASARLTISIVASSRCPITAPILPRGAVVIWSSMADEGPARPVSAVAAIATRSSGASTWKLVSSNTATCVDAVN